MPVSRECITAFLIESLHENERAESFDHYRKIRNRINYCGRKISSEVAIKGAKEITEAFKALKARYAKF